MENFGTRLSVEDIWRVVLFLKTIPNGGLREMPTPEMYIRWTGYPELYRWADCFYPENLEYDHPEVSYSDNAPPGVGDVAAMTAPGSVNPEYAVVLYMLENSKIPCGADDPNRSLLDIVTAAANRPTEGYARMGTSQLQFIPPALIPPEQYGQSWLEKVWPLKMPTQ
jgi:hypothetical protein